MGRYSTDLNYIGFNPELKSLNFKLGFIEPFFTKSNSKNSEQKEQPENLETGLFIEEDEIDYPEEVQRIDLSKYAKFCEMGCTATDKYFEFMIVQPIKENKNDIWLMNDLKELKLVCNGLKDNCQ